MTGDLVVWLLFAVVLAALGARAWSAETGQGRAGRTTVRQRALTGGVVVAVVALLTAIAVRGGIELVDKLVSPQPVEVPVAPADPAAPVAPPGGAGAPQPGG